ncbi:MAG TPA: hypothetical protein VGO00_18935, partial [Kofleriaceae bacterium]|nr:hypothetical protein [Kofleriaceae bacterium]
FHSNDGGGDGVVDAPGTGADVAIDGPMHAVGRCAPLPMPANPVAVADVTSLRSALAVATPGTTITLADGHYDLATANLVISQPGVTIRSASDDATKVVFDAGFGAPIVVSASNVTIASVTVTGADQGIIVVPPFSGSTTADTIYDVTFTSDRTGIELLPFAAISGPFADQGTIACSRFIAGTDTCTAGTLGILGVSVRGWTVRDSRFDHLACSSGFRRTVTFFQGSRDTQIMGNLFVGGAGNILLGQDTTNVARSYNDTPSCGGTPEHRDGIVCNNAITGLDAPIPPAGDAFEEGIALWHACDPMVIHNTVVSPVGQTFTDIEYRYPDTNAHIINNLVETLPTARDGAAADGLTSDVTYGAGTDFVDPHADLHLSPTATEAAGESIAGLGVCATDADGKPRDPTQPTVGAYER